MKTTTKRPRIFAGYKAGAFHLFRARTIPQRREDTPGGFDWCYGPYDTRTEAEHVTGAHVWAALFDTRGRLVRAARPVAVAP
jgi:hypothetical protein